MTLIYVNSALHQKSHMFFIRNCIPSSLYECVCERYLLRIQYLLKIYNKTIVKTKQRNKIMTEQYHLEIRKRQVLEMH